MAIGRQNKRGRLLRTINTNTKRNILFILNPFTTQITMSSSNEIRKCELCTLLTSTNSYQCPHCLALFCSECLIKHHHYTVKYEFIDMVNQIDEILKRFLHHAHNQTEWTDHLTKDREQLQNYIRYIEKYYKHLPIIALPSSQWVAHVKSLISKSSFAIYEDCFKLLYSYSTSSFIKSS